ncbi:retrovirus-related Pol polyprotein from transposon 297 [Trichonephila clavata]|uniref:Retrovirus-related Pol polyprotein from transposon 297 n=1 Tax=Trichonephila clavata TaxID=2740835 RepID=A0A8X6IHS8_TRICU|nr:retrovirus-related Pol polyprotein from transposon 297 [Trichonephila clavata]
MFLPDGKLERPSLGPSSGGTMVINRLYLSDRTSRSKYLTDTGADVSVIPLSTVSKHLPPASLQLFATNGTVISTYGQTLVTLDLGLHRVFKWSFIIAGVSQPIIEADFLRYYGLLVDIRHGCLVDSLTKLHTQAWYSKGIILESRQSIATPIFIGCSLSSHLLLKLFQPLGSLDTR